jgi:hypothetical protein
MNSKSGSLVPKKLLYFLAFFIISFTFQNFFKKAEFKLGIIIFFFALFVTYLRKINMQLFRAIFVMSVIIFIQGLMFNYSPVSHFTSLYINLFLAFVLLKVLPFNYHKYLIKVIFVLSVISFLLWIVVNLNSTVHNLIPEIARAYGLDDVDIENRLAGGYEQIIIFTFEKEEIYGIIRNAGFCHEPGAYGVVLIYAIVFGVFQDRVLFSKRNIFFIICLFSTLSTANFLAFFFILMFHLLHTVRKKYFSSLIFTLVFIGLAIPFVGSLNFMNEKIKNEFQSQTSASLNEGTSGRFLGARKSLFVLEKYPFTGRGFTTASKETDFFSAEAASYGFFNYASEVGLIVFIITMVLFYKTLKFWGQSAGFNTKEIVVLSLAFLPVLFSQAFIPSILFNMLILETYFRNYKIKFLNIQPKLLKG